MSGKLSQAHPAVSFPLEGEIRQCSHGLLDLSTMRHASLHFAVFSGELPLLLALQVPWASEVAVRER